MNASPTPWYFADGDSVRGPLSQDELEDLFEDRTLAADCLVWCPDLEEWTPAVEIEVLREAVPESPPPPPLSSQDEVSLNDRVTAALRSYKAVSEEESEVDQPSGLPDVPVPDENDPEEQDDGSAAGEPTRSTAVEAEAKKEGRVSRGDTHAWRRFFARQLDYLMWGLPGSALIGYMLVVASPEMYTRVMEWPDQLWGMLAAAAWIPVEAFLLSWYGWTPGKWLLSVKVRPKQDRPLQYGDTLARAVDVWFRGVGMGIPLVAVFTQLVAANKLNKKGETSWDESHRFTVRCGSLRAGRVITAVVLGVGLLSIGFALTTAGSI